MVIELKNEQTNQVKKINHGINYFLLFTSPIFGITLLKNNLKRSGVLMLIASVLLVLSIILFSAFTSSHASMYPYAASAPADNSPSFLVNFYYLLDIDYEDILEFFITSCLLLILFLTAMAIFVGFNANKWIAEQYRYEGYKVVTDNRLVYNLLKKDWGLTNDDFISSEAQ